MENNMSSDWIGVIITLGFMHVTLGVAIYISRPKKPKK